MNISYTYKIISIDEESRCMVVEYSAQDRETISVGTRLPSLDKPLSDIIIESAPLQYWIELDRVVVLPTIGEEGQIHPTEIVIPTNNQNNITDTIIGEI